MTHKPHVALFKTASGSLARRQIQADFLQSTAKQRIPPERLSKLTATVIFSCHIARLAMLESNWKILCSNATPMPNFMALMGSHFYYEASMALSAKTVLDSWSTHPFILIQQGRQKLLH